MGEIKNKYCPKNLSELKKLVDRKDVYLGDIDTSKVKDFSHLFYHSTRKDFSGIETWNTSNVKLMNSVFSSAKYFNVNINSWDTSKVESMNYMFYGCSEFNQPLDKWNTSKVKDIAGMFSKCGKFNQDLSSWDTSNVETMMYTFYEAFEFNQPLDSWNVSKVKKMTCLFYDCHNFNQPLDSWDTSSVEDMSFLFQGCYEFNYPINHFNVSNVKEMKAIFQYCHEFNQPLDKWDTSNVENMSWAFYGTKKFNQPLENWNVSKVKEMKFMFGETESFNQPLNSWNVENLADGEGLFEKALVFNQPLDKWDIRSLKFMEHMFYKAKSFNHSLKNWDISQATFTEIFKEKEKFYEIFGVEPIQIKREYFPKSKEELKQLILREVDFAKIDTSAITDMSYLFFKVNVKSFKGIETWDVSNVKDMTYMFVGQKDFNININVWDVSNVENMSHMFQSCETFDQPLESWNVSKVKNMGEMFAMAKEFSQDLDEWDTSNVENMSGMFYGATYFEGNISSWNTSKVQNMSMMFKDTYFFNGDIGNWDISNVKSMMDMFVNAKSFNQPLDKWDVSNVEKFDFMFENAEKFDQDLSSWKLSTTSTRGILNYTPISDKQSFPMQFIVARQIESKDSYSWEKISKNPKLAYEVCLEMPGKSFKIFANQLLDAFPEELADVCENSLFKVNSIEEIEDIIEKNFTKRDLRKVKFIDECLGEKELSDVLTKDRTKNVSMKLTKYIYFRYLELKKDLYRIKEIDRIIGFLDEETLLTTLKKIFFDTSKELSAVVLGVCGGTEGIKTVYKSGIRDKLMVNIIGLVPENKYAFGLLYNVYRKFRKYQIQDLANGILKRMAEDLGIIVTDLSLKMVQDFGFDRYRQRVLKVGEKEYKLTFLEDEKIEITDLEKNKVLKSIPRTFPENIKEEIKFLRKEIPSSLKKVNDIIVKLFINGNRYKTSFWREVFIENPLMNKYATDLIWGIYDKYNNLITYFRYNGDGGFSNCDDDEIEVLEDGFIRLATPVEMDSKEVRLWREQLADYEIVQPIPQFTHLDLDFENLEKEVEKLQGTEVSVRTFFNFGKKYDMDIRYSPDGDITGYTYYIMERFEIETFIERDFEWNDFVTLKFKFSHKYEDEEVSRRFMYAWLIFSIYDLNCKYLFE